MSVPPVHAVLLEDVGVVPWGDSWTLTDGSGKVRKSEDGVLTAGAGDTVSCRDGEGGWVEGTHGQRGEGSPRVRSVCRPRALFVLRSERADGPR